MLDADMHRRTDIKSTTIISRRPLAHPGSLAEVRGFSR
jgi:hypothetical protein